MEELTLSGSYLNSIGSKNIKIKGFALPICYPQSQNSIPNAYKQAYTASGKNDYQSSGLGECPSKGAYFQNKKSQLILAV